MKIKCLILAFATLLITSCNNSNKNCEAGDSACCKKQETNVTTPKTEEMKKVISAQVFIKPEKVEQFLEKTKTLIESSRSEAGNISYSLYQDPTDQSKFLFFEEWKDQAAIDFHFATEHFTSFGATLEECGSSPAIIKIFDIASEK